MFHVEQYVKNFFRSSHFISDDIVIEKLSLYAHRILETNRKFNLTGFCTIEDITEKLIAQSIQSFLSLNVPRGTKFIDMGTGAGIPGLPLCIALCNLTGTLVDSNTKKINFIHSIIDELEIKNADAVCARGEDITRDSLFRQSFFFATSRAFSNVFVTSEICAPFVQTGGFVYVYSNDELPQSSEHPLLFQHFSDLGIRPALPEERSTLGFGMNDIVLIKISETPEKFPRRFAAIKREAEKILMKS